MLTLPWVCASCSLAFTFQGYEAAPDSGSDAAHGGGHGDASEDQAHRESGSHAHDASNDASSTAGSYANEIMADAPLVYYPMDETSGTVLHDLGPLHLEGTYGSAVVLGAAGLLLSSSETAAHFNGGMCAQSNVASVAPSSSLEPTVFSVELFVEEDEVNPTPGGAIDLVSEGPNATQPFSLQISGDNHFQVYLETGADASGGANFVGNTELVPHHVYQVVMTYDGNKASLYVDGQLDSSMPAGGSIYYSALDGYGLGIGCGYDEPFRNALVGRIGQVSLYSSVLGQNRVGAHWRASRDGSDGGPLGDATTPAGSLSVTLVDVADGFDITAVGAVDWLVWPDSTSPERKATGGSLISWTDGMPDTTGSMVGGGITDVYGATGAGVTVAFPLGTGIRITDVYVQAYNQAIVYTAHLSDGSAADVTGTLFSGPASSLDLYSIRTTAMAASAGQTLTVQVLAASPDPYDGGGGGQIYIRAAAIEE